MPKIEIASPDRSPFGRLTLDVHGGLTMISDRNSHWQFLFHTRDIRGFMGIYTDQKRTRYLLEKNNLILVKPDNYGNLHVIEEDHNGQWTIKPIQTAPNLPVLIVEKPINVRFFVPTKNV